MNCNVILLTQFTFTGLLTDQVVYRLLGNICCADRSRIFFFWSWKSHGKSML